MMRILGVMFLACLALSSSAQHIRWSEALRLDRGDREVAIHAVSDSTFMFRHVRNDAEELFRLDHYATSLTLLESHVALWPQNLPDGSDFLELYPCGKQWLALFEHTNKKENYHSLFGQIVTREGSWIGELKEIVRIDYEKWDAKEFDVALAPDSSAYLVSLNGPFDKAKSEEVHLAVFDAFLDITWEKHLVLPYSNDQVYLSSALLDGYGNAHLYAAPLRPKVRIDAPRSSDKKKNHTLFSYYPETNTLKELDVDIGTHWITDAAMSLSPEGHIGVAGLYSSGPYEQTLGAFHFLFHAQNRSHLAKSLTTLPDSVVKLFTKSREIPNLYLDHVRFFSDHGAELIAERFEVIERISTDPATGRQVVNYSYRYQDLLVVRLNVGGHIDAHYVPKSQSFTNDHELYSGYACIPEGQRTVLLFNDHPDNASVMDDSRSTLSGTRKVSVAQVEIGPSSGHTRSHVDFQDDDDTHFRPEICLLPGGHIVVFSQYKRSFRLGILEF